MEIIEILNELTKDAVDVIKDTLAEELKPLIEHRKKVEKKIADKAIEELYKLEEEV